jgi:hypothetical protein
MEPPSSEERMQPSHRTRLIAVTGIAVLFAAACDRTESTAPSALPAAPSLSRIGESCVIDIGRTESPLPALHELGAWINESIDAAGSGVNCGQTRSLDAKMEAIAKALDQTPRNFHAACGVSGALLTELSLLVSSGQLPSLTFPPPVQGAPTNVLGLAALVNSQWCAAARGDLVGPNS